RPNRADPSATGTGDDNSVRDRDRRGAGQPDPSNGTRADHSRDSLPSSLEPRPMFRLFTVAVAARLARRALVTAVALGLAVGSAHAARAILTGQVAAFSTNRH